MRTVRIVNMEDPETERDIYVATTREEDPCACVRPGRDVTITFPTGDNTGLLVTDRPIIAMAENLDGQGDDQPEPDANSAEGGQSVEDLDLDVSSPAEGADAPPEGESAIESEPVATDESDDAPPAVVTNENPTGALDDIAKMPEINEGAAPQDGDTPNETGKQGKT